MVMTHTGLVACLQGMLCRMDRILTECLSRKMAEDLQLLAGLLNRLPPGSEEWRPEMRAGFTVSELRQHLTEAAGAICACFHRLHPQRLRHFEGGQSGELEGYRLWAAEGFQVSEDADLSRTIATYFYPEGEVFLSVLMSNWKHLHFHTYQLFTYLREMGVAAETKDLYFFSERKQDLQDLPRVGHDVIHG
jgi:hypothetical protein